MLGCRPESGFLWQLIRGKLPCSEQVAKRLGPSNGECALCGALEDCNHIFFACSLAKFMWAGVREVLQCAWKPAGVGDFLSISSGLSGPLRRLVWFTFAVQCWALWIIRNKLMIEGNIINTPSDVLLQVILFMQRWRPLTRQQDRDLLDEATGAIRRLHARLGT
jgi:hypothetical protein